MESILATVRSFTGPTTVPEAPLPALACSPQHGRSSGAERRKREEIVLDIVCFSKDRPYQLSQLLQSIEESLIGKKRVTVLYKDSQSEGLYSFPFAQFPHVRAIPETDFNQNLRDILSVAGSHVLFCVDDLIFTAELSIQWTVEVLEEVPTAFALQLKLHAGIIYSHAASSACFAPPLTLLCQKTSCHPAALSFQLAKGEVDWRYPFDLCGGLYRSEDLRVLINTMDTIRNPNLFEMYGNEAFFKLLYSTKYATCLCIDRPSLQVITINRVQDEFHVPTFPASPDHSLDRLNGLLSFPDRLRGIHLARYKHRLFPSVHIGELWQHEAPSELIITSSKEATAIKLTVLIPMWNAASCVQACIRSLLSEQGCSFRILVVDDGSTDDSVYQAQSLISEATAAGIELQVQSRPHEGLARTLDFGLQMISTELVARLDVDDICLPGRLARQLAFLEDNPSIHVLGGQAVIVRSDACGHIAATASSTTNMKTLPLLVLHSMCIRCPLLHPTVMFRRQTILDVGGYTGDDVRLCDLVEDYALWERVARRHPLGLANLPDLLIELRCHEKSKSYLQRHEATSAAHAVRARFVNRMRAVDSTPLGDLLPVIVHPQARLEDPASVQAVLQCWDDIHQAFLRTYVEPNVNPQDISYPMLTACLEALRLQRGAAVVAVAQEKWGVSSLQHLDYHFRQLYCHTMPATQSLKAALARYFA